MVLRIQISFKTIKLGERKEDLRVIELSENTQTSSKERVYFYALKLGSSTEKKNERNFTTSSKTIALQTKWETPTKTKDQDGGAATESITSPGMPTTPTGISTGREKYRMLP